MPGEQSIENGKKGGRPRGRKNDKTIEKEKVLVEVQNRIMNKAQIILDAQFSLAQGQQFLYRIDTTTDSKGKKTRSKPILVNNQEEISSYLDGEYGDGDSVDTDTEFYFITTKEPNNIAIDSMFNRTFGKPTESINVNPGELRVIFDPIFKNDITPPKTEGDNTE